MTALSVFDELVLHPFFHDLPIGWLRMLAVHGRPVLRHTGYRVFREDGRADRFWALRSGAVALDFHVPGRGDIVIERVGADSVVGWSWLLVPYRWTFGAVVTEDCHAIEFDAAQVRLVIEQHPEFGREITARLLAVTAGRLQAARHRLVELYAYPDQRDDASGPG